MKGSTPLARQTFTTLMRRLSRAGFKKDFISAAILPDWWDDACAEDPSVLPDVELRAARFLGQPVATMRAHEVMLASPDYPGAQLRRVREIGRDRLAPTIHSAIRIAEAVVRSLRDDFPSVALPPDDGLAWRTQIPHVGPSVHLADILGDLWQRGIAVVPVEVLPAPSFQGLSCVVEGRPVILLAHQYDEPGRLAFLIGHEVGHVVSGDCTPDHPVVDEAEEVMDDADMEVKADRYATRLVAGQDQVPEVEADDWRALAYKAGEIERTQGADAGAVIFAWARQTLDYPSAAMAVKALYRAKGARRLLRRHFDQHVVLDSASESDRALLRCVFGDPERNATGS